jgi:hypothetical protein
LLLMKALELEQKIEKWDKPKKKPSR